MKLLIVLTSHSQLGETQLGNAGGKTGFWIEEFAAPYYLFEQEGYTITLASPKGGEPPIDPASDAPDTQTPAVKQFKNDTELQEKLKHTIPLAELDAGDFDAVFYPGGHGPMWDLVNDKDSIALLEEFLNTKKPMALVCHGPVALLHVIDKKGELLVKGKKVTGFSNTEEEAVKLTNVVPFLLEDQLKMKGGIYSKAADWEAHVVTDGILITGQNPASSESVAKELIAALSTIVTLD